MSIKSPRFVRDGVKCCVFCDDPIDAKATVCPYCRTDQQTRQRVDSPNLPQRSRPWLMPLVVLLLIGFLYFLL